MASYHPRQYNKRQNIRVIRGILESEGSDTHSNSDCSSVSEEVVYSFEAHCTSSSSPSPSRQQQKRQQQQLPNKGRNTDAQLMLGTYLRMPPALRRSSASPFSREAGNGDNEDSDRRESCPSSYYTSPSSSSPSSLPPPPRTDNNTNNTNTLTPHLPQTTFPYSTDRDKFAFFSRSFVPWALRELVVALACRTLAPERLRRVVSRIVKASDKIAPEVADACAASKAGDVAFMEGAHDIHVGEERRRAATAAVGGEEGPGSCDGHDYMQFAAYRLFYRLPEEVVDECLGWDGAGWKEEEEEGEEEGSCVSSDTGTGSGSGYTEWVVEELQESSITAEDEGPNGKRVIDKDRIGSFVVQVLAPRLFTRLDEAETWLVEEGKRTGMEDADGASVLVKVLGLEVEVRMAKRTCRDGKEQTIPVLTMV